ncbi:MAG: class II fructose-bisphosphate aldolase [Actinomycetota bacterium]
MLVTSKELYAKAKAGKYAIGAFNTSMLEVTWAIIMAAQELKAPVIIETSEGEIDFLTPEISFAEVKMLADQVDIPIVLHVDHGKRFEVVEKAVKAGYTSVHVDGSSLPYEENAELTKRVVKLAHEHGEILVEGEIGHITGASEAHDQEIRISRDTLTVPEEAKRFVDETGIDVLAVAIGNIHGVYKNPPTLDFARLEELGKVVDTYFSLHGGSGIPKDQIKRAISLGVTKVNVSTELRLAFHNGLAKEFAEHPDNVVPYKYLPLAREAVKKVVESKIKMFGCAGQA